MRPVHPSRCSGIQAIPAQMPEGCGGNEVVDGSTSAHFVLFLVLLLCLLSHVSSSGDVHCGPSWVVFGCLGFCSNKTKQNMENMDNSSDGSWPT